jgi:excisionase family DNA binding protein
MRRDIGPVSTSPRLVAVSMIPFQERPTCTVAEACHAAGFGKTKLYELMDGGSVDSVRIGRRRLIRVPSLLRLLGADRHV